MIHSLRKEILGPLNQNNKCQLFINTLKTIWLEYHQEMLIFNTTREISYLDDL